MNPPKTILVPTDFSEGSEAALLYAIALAEKLGAELHVVHGFEFPLVGFPDGVLTISAEIGSRIVDAAQTALDALAAKHAARKADIHYFLKEGDPREVVLGAAEKVSADLIVMGTHGRRGIARALVGSVAESVVRTATVPVLTVRVPSHA